MSVPLPTGEAGLAMHSPCGGAEGHVVFLIRPASKSEG
jgi:hypothetical protein